MSESAFFAAICEHPDDDTPRLVFADWLEEHGQSVRAAFIRDQIALSHLDESAPHYPELLARTRRSGVLTDKAHRLECERGLEGVMFRRGFIAGLRTYPANCLPTDLAPLPLEQLFLTQPESDEFEIGKAVAICPELAKLKTLVFEHGWRVGGIADLLASPHLAGLRNLAIGQPHFDDIDTLRDMIGRLALPSLDSFSLHFGNPPHLDDEDYEPTPDTDWSGFVPRNPLRRLHLTADDDTTAEWEWPGPDFTWLIGPPNSPHWTSLEVADVTLNANPISGTDYTAAMPPHGLPRVLGVSRLRRLIINGSNLDMLLDTSDWGCLRELAVHDEFNSTQLRRLFTHPQAQRLTSLTLCGDHIDHDQFDMGTLPDVIRTPGLLPKLRRLSLRAELAALANGSYREHLLRLDVGTPGILGEAWPGLLNVPLPQLRHLTLCGFRNVDELTPLFTASNMPNLCTLQLDDHANSRGTDATWNGIARNPAMPHLSVLTAGTWMTKRFILGNGEVMPIEYDTTPLDEDWWEPDPLAYWFW